MKERRRKGKRDRTGWYIGKEEESVQEETKVFSFQKGEIFLSLVVQFPKHFLVAL